MKMNLLVGALVFAGLVGCTANTEVDLDGLEGDEVTGVSEDSAVAVTYKQTAKLITTACGGCHDNYKTLAGIKVDRLAMIGRISSGSMPLGNPKFKTSAAGKKVLSWLQTGADAR